jgi:hypothetical protein
MECKNDNTQTLQMAGPYAFGCAIRRKGALYSLVCDSLGDIANLRERFYDMDI